MLEGVFQKKMSELPEIHESKIMTTRHIIYSLFLHPLSSKLTVLLVSLVTCLTDHDQGQVKHQGDLEEVLVSSVCTLVAVFHLQRDANMMFISVLVGFEVMDRC